MTLTILTPTYNRIRELGALYNSLKKQTCMTFEWVIVDDGSTDDTFSIINKWADEDIVNIKTLKKVNGGKHTALNYAIKKITSELIFIVDSDDILTLDAVEIIYKYHSKYADNESVCGYSFLRAFPNGEINGKEFQSNELIASYIETRLNSNDVMSDKAEVFKTKCLKEFPFPEFCNEKFLGEDIIWIQMARKYKMVHINKAIYIGNYQEDGLTKNRRIHNIKSPIGCMKRAEQFMKDDINYKIRLKASLQYIVYGKFAKRKISELYKCSNQKGLVIIAIIPGYILYKVWKREYRVNF